MPFLDKEVQLYQGLNDIQYNFENDLKYVTGYNPIATSHPKLSFKKVVFRNIKFCVQKFETQWCVI